MHLSYHIALLSFKQGGLRVIVDGAANVLNLRGKSDSIIFLFLVYFVS